MENRLENKKLIVSAEGNLLKLEADKRGHLIPMKILNNPNFILKLRDVNIVDLYDDGSVTIRPKGKDD